MKLFSKAFILLLLALALPLVAFAQQTATQTIDLGDGYSIVVPADWVAKQIQPGAFTLSGGGLTMTATTPTLLQKLNIRFDPSTSVADVLVSLALPFNGVQLEPENAQLSLSEGRETASYTNTTNQTVDQRYAVVALGDGEFGYLTVTGIKGVLEKQQAVIDAVIASFKNVNAPTATPTVATDTPTATATVPTSTPTNTPTDTATPVPSSTPTDTATPIPSATFTDTPTASATVPTSTPSSAPTDTPTTVPSTAPTDTPTTVPSAAPTDTPTTVPSAAPTDTPTPVPSTAPTDTPTPVPSAAPTDTATPVPSAAPTDTSTTMPTNTPTDTPTPVPSAAPTDTPTTVPSATLTDTATPMPSATLTDTATPMPTNTALPESCTVSIDKKNTATLRVGPGTNRGAISYLLPNLPVSVTGRTQLDDGSIWFQLDKDQAAPNGTFAAELWVNALDVTANGDCAVVGVVVTPPIIHRATATPTGGSKATSEVTSEPTNEPTTEATAEPTGTPTKVPTAEPTSRPSRTPTNTPAPSNTPAPTAAPVEGSIVPTDGQWTLTFNAQTNTSCQGGPNSVVQSSSVFETMTFSAALRAIDADKISYGADIYVRVPGTNTFTGQFTLEHSPNAQVWLTLNSKTSILGQVTNNFNQQGTPCSATALFLLERK